MPTSSPQQASGTVLTFPRRKLAPSRRVCLGLGLPVDAQPGTNLARLLRKAGLGRTAIEYLRFSDDKDAQTICALYRGLNATERKAATIDLLAMAAGMDIHHALGVIIEQLSRVKAAETTMLACVNASRVTEKGIQYALTPGGFADRELILRIVGAVTTPSSQPCAASGKQRRRI